MAIEKRHVRMKAVSLSYDEDGNETRLEHVAEDYVPVDILNAYLEDARSRWPSVVVVSDEHNPGPGGDEGLTHFPHHLSEGHPHQGKTVDGSGNYVGV